MPKPNRIALVIGNSAYNPDPLPNPVRDAALITQRLKQLGFTIIGGASNEKHQTGHNEGADPSTQKTFALVQEFMTQLTPGCEAVIYYAGHALQVGDQNYLMPIDTDLDPNKPELGLIKIKECVQRAAARAGADGIVAVFLDACRNNPLDDKQMRVILGRFADAQPVEFGQGGAVAVSRGGLSSMKMDRNADQARTFIGLATAPGDVAYDGKKGNPNSPFAQALDRHLATRGLEIEELYNRVAKDVLDQVGQEIRRYQDPWSETNLNRSYYLHPGNGWPIVVLGLAGLVVGALICTLIFDRNGIVSGIGRPWIWSLGLLFGVIAAFGTQRWGSKRPLDIFLAFVGPGFGFALALAILKIIPVISSWNVAYAAGDDGLHAHRVFTGVTLAGGALYLIGTALVWRDNPPAWPRSKIQWLNRILTWSLPLIVIGALLLLQNYLSRTHPLLTAKAMFVVLGGVIYAISMALACRGQRGLFSHFGPATGGITVGLLMAAFFAVFESVCSSAGIRREDAVPFLISLGAMWHMLLGAQLGYCFAYYVPDHKPWAPEAGKA